MGRAPCCDKANVKKGPWSPEEDAKLKEFIDKFGTGGNWIALPQKAGLKRCGKSCRLRWLNYLRPNIKHGEFSDDEDRIICTLYASIGSRWSIMASQLPGRTDNDIKNYWNTKLKKKLMGMIPSSNNGRFSHQISNIFQPQSHSLSSLSQFYNSFYLQAAKSLSTLEQNSAPNNFPDENFSLSTPQYPYYQEDLQYYPGKDNNMLIFGGTDQTSCSSSDGSCSQISYGRDHVKPEEIGFQGFGQNGFEGNRKFLVGYGQNDEHRGLDGIMENSGIECDLEEVKQLISTGNNNCSSSSFLFNDENKTHDERESMYYY